MSDEPIWLMIDGNNHVHRDYHAAGIDRVGQVLDARIDNMIGKWNPERVMVAFDSGRCFRHQIVEDYKAGRERPADIDEAIEIAKEVAIGHAADVLAVAGFEADDIIATWTRMARRAGKKVLIASSDKDLHQLLEKGVVCQLTRFSRSFGSVSAEFINSDRLYEKYGVRPDQWVEYRMLTGDPSDNIGGVQGFGGKTAAKLLQTCGDLSLFFRSPFSADVTDRLRNRLLQAKDTLERLRLLVSLRDDVPMPEYW